MNEDGSGSSDKRLDSLRRLWDWIERPGLGNWLFGPRSFGGGRVRVYGCSPGCLLLMLFVSLLLTIVLNALANWLL